MGGVKNLHFKSLFLISLIQYFSKILIFIQFHENEAKVDRSTYIHITCDFPKINNTIFKDLTFT